MSPTLDISLLGGFSLAYGGQPLSSFSTGRLKLLLAYLVLQRDKVQPRERVAFYIWPDSNEAQARANLRKTLSQLRRSLPQDAEFLWVEKKTLQWSTQSNYALDVAAFEAAVQQAEANDDRATSRHQLEQAISLYQGDLLPDCEDEWIFPERERLRQLYSLALERLTRLLEETRDYTTALNYAQQMLRLDTLNEAAHCLVMRLYSRLGDRANALQTYHQCMTLLRDELGVDPSVTTRKLYEQLLYEEDLPEEGLNQSDVVMPSRVAATTMLPKRPEKSQSLLIGRRQEWAAIRQWASLIFQAASTQAPFPPAQPEVLLLVGEPGIGKTRLLEELRTIVRQQAANMLWAQGFAAEMMRPYGVWIDALRSSGLLPNINQSDESLQLAPELRFLLPELGEPPSMPPDPSQLLDAVVQLLVQRSQSAPLVIVLDDIQWFDEASSALMHYAMRLLRHSPVLFACTARAKELEDNAAVKRVVQSLRREQCLQQIELDPLDREQTADLMRSVDVVTPDDLSLDVVNQVFIDSGGNPLFALEIARSIAQNHAKPTDSLEELIQDRLQRLNESAQEVLPWAAALGRSFNPSTIARVASYPLAKLLGAIEELEAQSIIRPTKAMAETMGAGVLSTESGYDFVHDIVRRVIYEQLSIPRRQLVHLQISQQLQEQCGDDAAMAGDIAHHAVLGGDRAVAAAAYLGAAEHAQTLYAFAEAGELAQKGLSHCEVLPAKKRIPLSAKLIEVCMVAGVTGKRGAELVQQAQALVQEAEDLSLPELGLTMSALLNIEFKHDDYETLHEQSLRVAEVSRLASPVTAAELLAHSGSCLAEIGRDMIRAEAVLLEAQVLIERLGIKSADLACGLGCVHRHYGRYAAARKHLQQTLRLVRLQEDRWVETLYLRYLVQVEIEADRLDEAATYAEELCAVATQIESDDLEIAGAEALRALVQYRSQYEFAAQDLLNSLDRLEQLDSKRSRSYVLVWAAEQDLRCEQYELAVTRAVMALGLAKLLDQPSEMAHSWAIWVKGAFAMGDRDLARQQYEILQTVVDRDFVNLPARRALDEMRQVMQARAPSVRGMNP